MNINQETIYFSREVSGRINILTTLMGISMLPVQATVMSNTDSIHDDFAEKCEVIGQGVKYCLLFFAWCCAYVAVIACLIAFTLILSAANYLTQDFPNQTITEG